MRFNQKLCCCKDDWKTKIDYKSYLYNIDEEINEQ